MSYHPHLYLPNSEKTVFSFVHGTVNSTMNAGDRIEIESSGFAHSNFSVNSNGQFVITSGEHLIVSNPYSTMSPTNSGNAEMVFRWYDITNSQYLGVAGRRVLRASAATISDQRAPLACCYVDSAITLELRVVSRSGNNVNAWDNLNLYYRGLSWGYIYSPI